MTRRFVDMLQPGYPVLFSFGNKAPRHGHVVDAMDPERIKVRFLSGEVATVHFVYLKPWTRLPGPLAVIQTTMAAAKESTMKRSEGERIRIVHALARLLTAIESVETAITLGGPIGTEVAQALMQTAAEIGMQIAKHDAFEQVDHDAETKQ